MVDKKKVPHLDLTLSTRQQPGVGVEKNGGGVMRSEKRSLSIDEMKEVLKSELVTKICGGRVWVVRTVNVKKEETDEK